DQLMTMAAQEDLSDAQAVTFFNIAKQIPKGVKRHCGMCRQHGVVAQTRNHGCPFKNCECTKCNLVRQRRSIMSMQIRLRREQDKMFVRTSEPDEAEVVPPSTNSESPSACYFCQKCKNHGVLKWKKDHKKNCQFANCSCKQCELIDTRRALDSHIKKGKKRTHDEDESRWGRELEREIPMASSMASSPTLSDGHTPSIPEYELSQSLSALCHSPEMNVAFSSAVPFLATLPTKSLFTDHFISTQMLLQNLVVHTSPQSSIAPSTTVSTLPPSTIVSTLPSLSDTSVNGIPSVQYLNLIHSQSQPTVLIQNPHFIPQSIVPLVSQPPTVFNNLSQMDIHNFVSSLMLNSRA
ncbi:hypothetical protein PMAYCL1PPCAC_29693, partial [Pristionchus mayeri]